MNISAIRFFAAAALGALALAACSGGGQTTVSVSMREFSFSPDGLTVPTAAEVTLTLRNLGALEHNFHLMDLGYVVAEAWSETDEQGAFYSHTNVPGGDVETVTFTAPNTPGEYQFLCSVPSHLELGMEGVLTVTER